MAGRGRNGHSVVDLHCSLTTVGLGRYKEHSASIDRSVQASLTALDKPRTAVIIGFMSKTFTALNALLAQHPKSQLTERDLRFLSYAEQISRRSERERNRVGCVIAQRNTLISHGFNQRKTHPFQARWNRRSNCLHAEMAALLSALRRPDFAPERSTVYVSRYTLKGRLGCSYPCESCWAALDHVGIRQIVCLDETDQPTKICLK